MIRTLWGLLPEPAKAAFRSRIARATLDAMHAAISSVVDGADSRVMLQALYHTFSREAFVVAVASLRDWIGPRERPEDAALLAGRGGRAPEVRQLGGRPPEFC